MSVNIAVSTLTVMIAHTRACVAERSRKHYFHHGLNDPSEVDGNNEEETMAFRRTGDDVKQWIIDNFADLKTVISDNDA